MKGFKTVTNGQLVLNLPDGAHISDTSGLVELSKSIMPDVWRIITFSGINPDIECVLIDGEWRVHDFNRKKGGEISESSVDYFYKNQSTLTIKGIE